MTDWTETFRGTVAPWECDVTEHFTIAYYLDRIEEASASIAEILELGDTWRTGGFPRRLNFRFTRELRAGDSFHIESAAIGVEGALRLGRRPLPGRQLLRDRAKPGRRQRRGPQFPFFLDPGYILAARRIDDAVPEPQRPFDSDRRTLDVEAVAGAQFAGEAEV